MSSYEFSHAKCPYWKQSDKLIINCEGMVERQLHAFKFMRLNERVNWGDKYCCRNWGDCPWAKVLNKKYDT